jgi:hypothetical protein
VSRSPWLCVGAALVLIGCLDDPSSDDLEAAVSRNVDIACPFEDVTFEDPPPGVDENQSYGDALCAIRRPDPGPIASIAPGAPAACSKRCAGLGYKCTFLYDRTTLFGTTTYCHCFDPPLLGTCNAAGWAGAINFTRSTAVP